MKVNMFLICICSVWELVALNRLLLMCPNTDVTTGKIKVVILILIPSSYQWFLNTINRFWSFPPLSGSSLSSSSPPLLSSFPAASLPMIFFPSPHPLSLSLSLSLSHPTPSFLSLPMIVSCALISPCVFEAQRAAAGDSGSHY